uniref:Uncharacterized protein n=1 Tax=Cynoglossus semilaevis TaxID=244447 RepID=A0A3P8UZI5_CYNSE
FAQPTGREVKVHIIPYYSYNSHYYNCKGVALSHRSELQQVLERRKRVQSDQEEEQQSKTPLDDVLLRRQQKQHEREKKDEEKEQEEAHLMEFVRVRQNLRKIHSVIQNKSGNV